MAGVTWLHVHAVCWSVLEAAATATGNNSAASFSNDLDTMCRLQSMCRTPPSYSCRTACMAALSIALLAHFCMLSSHPPACFLPCAFFRVSVASAAELEQLVPAGSFAGALRTAVLQRRRQMVYHMSQHEAVQTMEPGIMAGILGTAIYHRR